MRKIKNAGFTLVETLMVMIVLGIVMMAASGMANTVIQSALQNENRVQAIYLTQQCTELLRNVRDSSWRQNIEWTCPFKLQPTDAHPTVYDPSDVTSQVFTIEPTQIGVASDCKKLGTAIATQLPEDAVLYEGNNGMTYDNSSGEQTRFNRYFTVDDYDPTTEMLELTCVTKWDQGVVRMGQRLTNWRKP